MLLATANLFVWSVQCQTVYSNIVPSSFPTLERNGCYCVFWTRKISSSLIWETERGTQSKRQGYSTSMKTMYPSLWTCSCHTWWIHQASISKENVQHPVLFPSSKKISFKKLLFSRQVSEKILFFFFFYWHSWSPETESYFPLVILWGWLLGFLSKCQQRMGWIVPELIFSFMFPSGWIWIML